VKAKFNVSLAEVDDNDVWNRAVLALALVGNERRFVTEAMDRTVKLDIYGTARVGHVWVVSQYSTSPSRAHSFTKRGLARSSG